MKRIEVVVIFTIFVAVVLTACFHSDSTPTIYNDSNGIIVSNATESNENSSEIVVAVIVLAAVITVTTANY